MSEEIEFRSEEFQDMLFDMYGSPRNKDLTKWFDNLGKYKEFQVAFRSISKNKLIRYIGYVYDRKSPVAGRVDNLIKRKIVSAQLAGFVPNEKGEFEKPVVEVMKGLNRKANKMILRYCRLQGRAYSLIVAGTEAYYDIIEQIQTKTADAKGNIIDDGEQKSKLFDKADSMLKKIDKLLNEMLMADRHSQLEDDLFLSIDQQEEVVKLSPETIDEEFA